eukprot:5634721-Prymnesium_polylepis.5
MCGIRVSCARSRECIDVAVGGTYEKLTSCSEQTSSNVLAIDAISMLASSRAVMTEKTGDVKDS